MSAETLPDWVEKHLEIAKALRPNILLIPDRRQADKTTQLKFHCCHFHEKESKTGREELGAPTVKPRAQGSELRATAMLTPEEI